MVSIIEPPSFTTAWSLSQASHAVNISRSLHTEQDHFTWDSLLPSLLSRVVVSIARRRFEPRLQVQSSRQ